jgi:hypothetical protein
MVSAFDNNERYELTELGKQFVHYAMTEIVAKIVFSEDLPDQGGADGKPVSDQPA